jgi:hypothetical protein
VPEAAVVGGGTDGLIQMSVGEAERCAAWAKETKSRKGEQGNKNSAGSSNEDRNDKDERRAYVDEEEETRKEESISNPHPGQLFEPFTHLS